MTLRWATHRDVSYYNIQVWLGGAKVLTTWPSGGALRLPNLAPGTYTWYVWPGLGVRSRHRYGVLLGKGTFVVAP